MMIYKVKIEDIEEALANMGGEARAKEIQDEILHRCCNGVVPDNYQHERSFRQTIQRKIEDYCPQAEGFDQSNKEGKFIRIEHGLYRLATGRKNKEFPAIEEVENSEDYIEGATKNIPVNHYERNVVARKKCIDHYGVKCTVCGFDFEATYGEVGKGFIHVHHIIPLSEIKSSYVVDPVNDLIPVCANCHAVIHRTTPSLTIKQLSEMLRKLNVTE